MAWRPRNPLPRTRSHGTAPEGFKPKGRRRVMLMTPHMAAIGGLLVFFSVVGMVVVLPSGTYNPPPSQNWLPLTDQALRGRAQYLANGCVYCHSGFSRPQDVFAGQYYLYPRVSEPGDYWGETQSPNVLGTERTGPDLSQEGGMHPPSWHQAHYNNPRFTMPRSIMPRFDFWSQEQLDDMIAFNQQQGGKEGVLRFAAVLVGNHLMQINAGVVDDPRQFFPQLVEDLTDSGEYVPEGQPSDVSESGLPWQAVWMINSFDRGYWLTDNPFPVNQENLIKGKQIYIDRCAGCHGVEGRGDGPAAEFFAIKPFNFHMLSNPNIPIASDGMMYHRILTAGPGTAMERFGTRLSVADIWKVVLFLRTIPNGSLGGDATVPTEEMYVDWFPPQALLSYIEQHPIAEQFPGPQTLATEFPFLAAAKWVAPGLAPGDVVLVGGKLPMTLERLTTLIREQYFDIVEDAYRDALERDEPDDLPPAEQIFDVSSVTFHMPS